MSKAESASECFLNGCNCAQAVLTAFCENFGLEKELALKIACPFGGGMGHSCETCGAVSGALMVLGLKYGPSSKEEKNEKAMSYLVAKNFISQFRKINGSVNCKELLECDLGNEEQLSAAQQSGIFVTKCKKYVSDAVNLLEEVMSEYHTDQ